MLNLNPPGIELACELPDDWCDQLLSYTATGATKALIEALQDFVRARGAEAIAVEHVQELALMVTGVSAQSRFRAYDRVFADLVEAAGGDWPIAKALGEQPLAEKPVFDAAQRLIACDGEWLVLRGLAQAGWLPKDPGAREGRDWTVEKNGEELPIEVKTKQAEGSGLGRLRFALRGLSMLHGSVFRRFTWHWNRGLELTQKAVANYFRLLYEAKPEVEAMLAGGWPLYDRRELARNAIASMHGQTYGEDKYAIDFSLVDTSLDDDSRAKGSVSLIAEPNRHTRFSVTGAVDARCQQYLDSKMLDDVEEFVFNRLGIVKQAAKRPARTIFMVIWEVPFNWVLDLTVVETRWKDWCARSRVSYGILLPFQVAEPPAALLTPSVTT
jgi:hypothetical protein